MEGLSGRASKRYSRIRSTEIITSDYIAYTFISFYEPCITCNVSSLQHQLPPRILTARLVQDNLLVQIPRRI